MLSWSSGLGRHPLTVEIAGSTPAGSEYFILSWIESREVVRIVFGFISVCVVWIKISDFKRNLMVQLQIGIIQILDDILVQTKIIDEVLMIQIQRPRLFM